MKTLKNRFALTCLAVTAVSFMPVFSQAFSAENAAPDGVMIYQTWLSDYDTEAGVNYGTGHLQMIGLTEEDRETFPALAQALDAYSADAEDTMRERFAEYCGWSRADHSEGREYEAFLQTDLLLRRADESVFSFLECYQDYSGGAHGYYSFDGCNYDVQTGEEIVLSDVIADEAAFRDVVCEKLTDQYGAEALEPSLRSILDDYVLSAEAEEPEFHWIMDQTGIHVMFNPYEIGPYAAGAQHVHIGFDEYPELFTGNWHSQTGSWAYQINSWLDEKIDPDGDGEYEDFAVSGDWLSDYTDDGKTSLSVHKGRLETNVTEIYYYGEPSCVLMHRADGRTFLYAEMITDNDYRFIGVFDMTGASPVWSGETDAGFGCGWNEDKDAFSLLYPTTPEHFRLSSRMQILSTWSGFRTMKAGTDGMPEPVGTQWYETTNYTASPLKTVRELPVTLIDAASMDKPAEEMSGTEGYIQAGEEIRIWRTDGETMVDVKREDGSAARISIDTGGWPRTIDGQDESSYFEMLYYAG